MARSKDPEGMTPQLIIEQREKGWPDFHPEDYCHLCGRPNVSWYVASPLWNAAHIEDEQARRGFRRSGIVCPQCFVALFQSAVPSVRNSYGHVGWELRADRDTLHHLPEELRADEAAWQEACENGTLSEYHAQRDRGV